MDHKWGYAILLFVGGIGCDDGGLAVVQTDLFFQPSSVDFGLSEVDVIHEEFTRLRNASGQTARVTDIRFNPPQDVFSALLIDGQPLRGQELGAQQQVQVMVRYRPLEVADHSTTMTVTFGGRDAALSISAMARRDEPGRPVVSPAALSFDGSEVNREVVRPVVVTNAGQETAALTSVTFQSPFRVTDASGVLVTSASPVLIEAGASVELRVYFRPDRVEVFEDEITFRFDNGNSAQLSVVGDPIEAGQLVCDQSSIVWGPVSRGTSVARSISCQVSGGFYELADIRLSEGTERYFRVPAYLPTLNDDQRLVFDVVFDAFGLPTTSESSSEHFGGIDIVAANGDQTHVSLSAETTLPEPGTTDVFLSLSWDTPSTDLDLHLVRPGGNLFELHEDCFFQFRHPDWGVIDNEADNPFLVPDDVDGLGPEDLHIPFAAEPYYDVYVNYYDFAEHTQAPATRLYVTYQFRNGSPVTFETTFTACGQTWYVGRIHMEPEPRFELQNTISVSQDSRCL